MFQQSLHVHPGSPPPMRGKVTVSSSSRVMMGITPAYAGKSYSISGASAIVWDHPRLCGEKSGGTDNCTKMLGSPPPMRGKVDPFRHRCRQTGITPAYAGKRCHGASSWCRERDHPRLCGEKSDGFTVYLQHSGSPPPMRGKEVDGNQRSLAYRITPAYAGKRLFQSMSSYPVRDHPRLCGEKPL